MSDAIHQKIVYEFETANQAFAAELREMYNMTQQIAKGASQAGAAFTKATSGSGGKAFSSDLERARSVVQSLNQTILQDEPRLKTLRREVSALGQEYQNIISKRGNDPSRNEALTLLEQERAARQTQINQINAAHAAQMKMNNAARDHTAEINNQRAQLGQLIQQAVQLAAAYVSIRTAVSAVQTGMNFNMMLQQNQTAFQVMLGDAGKAKNLMQQLRDIQNTTGIGVAEGASGSKQLLAYGFQAQDLVKELTMLKTVASAVNVPLNDMIYVYGTLRAQGRAYMRDITQFTMRGIPMYQALSDSMGVPVSQLKELVKQGKIGFEQVQAAMVHMTSEGGVFGGMLQAIMNTLPGQIQVMKNQFQTTMGAITAPMQPAMLEMVKTLTKYLQDMNTTEVGKSLEAFMGHLATALPKILPVATSLFKVLTDGMSGLLMVMNTLSPVLSIVAKLMETLSPVLTPALIGALVGLTGMKIANVAGASIAKGMESSTGVAISAITSASGAWSTLGNSMKSVNGVMSTLMANPFFAVTVWSAITMAISTMLDNFVKSVAKEHDKVLINAFSDTGTHEARVQAARDLAGTAYRLSTGNDDMSGAGGRGFKFTADQVASAAKAMNAPLLLLGKTLQETGNVTTDTMNQILIMVGNLKRGPNITGDYQAIWAGIYKQLGLSPENLGKLQIQEFGPKAKMSEILSKVSDTGSGTDRGQAVLDQMIASTAEEQKRLDLLKKDGANAEVMKEQYKNMWQTQFDYIGMVIENVSKFSVALGEPEDVLLKKLIPAWSELFKKIHDGDKAKEQDMWIEDELRSKLTANKIDDIDVAYHKQADAYKKQVIDGTVAAERLAGILSLLEQNHTKAIVDYKRELDVKDHQDYADMLAQTQTDELTKIKTISDAKMYALKSITDFESDEALRNHDLAIKLLGDQTKKELDAEKKKRNIAASNPVGQISEMVGQAPWNPTSEDWKAMTGGMMIQIKQSLIDAFSSFKNASEWQQAGNSGAAGSQIGQGMSSLGSVALSGAGALATGGASALIQMLMEAFSKLSGVVKIFEAPLALAADLLGPFSEALTYIIPVIKDVFGPVLKMLKPIMAAFAAGMLLVWAALAPLMPLFDGLTAALRALVDYVIVPMINVVLSIINSIIDGINYMFGWLGVHINKLPLAKTTSELDKMADAAQKAADAFNANIDVLHASMDYLENKIKDTVDASLKSLKDLYDVGAISATEFSSQSKVMTDARDAALHTNEQIPLLIRQANSLDELVALYKQAYDTNKAIDATATDDTATRYKLISDWLRAMGLPGIPGYAVGASKIPMDQIAQLHAGEMVVPSTFAQAVRNGQISIGGQGSGTSGGNVVVYLNVEGSVQTENDLIHSVAYGIVRQRQSGGLRGA